MDWHAEAAPYADARDVAELRADLADRTREST
jgi:hypothetical protein